VAETTFHDPEQRVLAIFTSGLIELQPYSGLLFVGWLLLASLFLFSSLMMPARKAAILVEDVRKIVEKETTHPEPVIGSGKFF
jgi:hypothetical protein